METLLIHTDRSDDSPPPYPPPIDSLPPSIQEHNQTTPIENQGEQLSKLQKMDQKPLSPIPEGVAVCLSSPSVEGKDTSGVAPKVYIKKKRAPKVLHGVFIKAKMFSFEPITSALQKNTSTDVQTKKVVKEKVVSIPPQSVPTVLTTPHHSRQPSARLDSLLAKYFGSTAIDGQSDQIQPQEIKGKYNTHARRPATVKPIMAIKTEQDTAIKQLQHAPRKYLN